MLSPIIFSFHCYQLLRCVSLAHRCRAASSASSASWPLRLLLLLRSTLAQSAKASAPPAVPHSAKRRVNAGDVNAYSLRCYLNAQRYKAGWITMCCPIYANCVTVEVSTCGARMCAFVAVGCERRTQREGIPVAVIMAVKQVMFART